MTTKDIEIGRLIYDVITSMEKLGTVYYDDEDSDRLYKIDLIVSGPLEIKEEGRAFDSTSSSIELQLGGEVVFRGKWKLIFEDEREWLYDYCDVIEFKKGPWVEELRLVKNKLQAELETIKAQGKLDSESRIQERSARRLIKRKKKNF